jgi:O-antigen biosynthesis protein
MKFKISLIIPTFCVPRALLEGCLSSVARQSLADSEFEVILFDDGSGDGTFEYMQNFAASRANFRVEGARTKKGVSAARNDAISFAQGDLVAVLDADDRLTEDALASTLAFHRSHPQVRYSYGRHLRITPEGVVIREAYSREYDPQLLLHMNFVSPLKVFDRKLHSDIGGYDASLPWAEDWDHALKAAEVLGREQFKLNRACHYLYVQHDLNSTKRGDEFKNRWRREVVNRALARRGQKGAARFSHETEDGYAYLTW